MKNRFAVLVVLLALATPVWAQEQKPAPASPPPPSHSLKVQVLLSRYQGDKKISSLPYTLMISTDERNRVGRATLRLGTQVPITTMTKQSSEANAPLVPSVQYRDVGTNIDCMVSAVEDGRFKVDVSVEDSSVETSQPSGATNTHPVFRSFRTSDSMLLRDGQTAQSSTGTDKVSADVWKVDVTLTVVK
jgi:hypothetical protein